MDNITIPIALYTRNNKLAYNVRATSRIYNVNIYYLSTLADLLAFAFENPQSIILLDLKCVNFVSVIKKYFEYRKDSEIVFIFITNDISKVKVNNYNTFVTTYDEVNSYLSDFNNQLIKIKKIRMSKNEKYYDNLIIDELIKFGVSTKHLGFNYLKMSILLAIKNQYSDIYLNNIIYPTIADVYHTTVQNVEKNIRCAIKRANELRPEAFDIDGFRDEKVTTRKFVAHIVRDIEKRINKECFQN